MYARNVSRDPSLSNFWGFNLSVFDVQNDVFLYDISISASRILRSCFVTCFSLKWVDRPWQVWCFFVWFLMRLKENVHENIKPHYIENNIFLKSFKLTFPILKHGSCSYVDRSGYRTATLNWIDWISQHFRRKKTTKLSNTRYLKFKIDISNPRRSNSQ